MPSGTVYVALWARVNLSLFGSCGGGQSRPALQASYEGMEAEEEAPAPFDPDLSFLDDGDRGYVLALHADTGRLKWARPFTDPFGDQTFEFDRSYFYRLALDDSTTLYAAGVTLNRARVWALRDMGSFHVGGRHIEISGQPIKEIVFTPGGVPAKMDPNGTYQVEQMYAQYFLVQNRKGKLPLLLWHGGGLSGVTYETKPDGKPGWLNYFLRQGWDVYISDAMERGRSGWTNQFKGEAVHLPLGDPWERFRIGPIDSASHGGRRRDRHNRSRLAGGAIVAAPTTSLPEQLGGSELGPPLLPAPRLRLHPLRAPAPARSQPTTRNPSTAAKWLRATFRSSCRTTSRSGRLRGRL